MSSSTSYILPHYLTEQDVTRAFFQYLAEGEFTSSDLVTEAKVLSCRKFHVPLHRFHGEYQASYTALVGVTSRETYLGTQRVWRGDNSTGSYHDELIEKGRDVTHWHPVSGERRGKFDLYSYCGSNHVKPEVQSLCTWFPASSEWRALSESDMVKLDVEAATADFASSFQHCERDLTELIRNEIAGGQAGDDVKDLRLSYNTSQDQSLVLNPLYHIRFEYKKQAYNFWVHGSDMARKACDQLPQDVDVKTAAGNAWWTAIIWTIAVPVAFYKYHEHLNGWKVAFGIAAVLASWMYSSHRHQKIVSAARTARQDAVALRLASLDGNPRGRSVPKGRVVPTAAAKTDMPPRSQVPAAEISTTQPSEPMTPARLSPSRALGVPDHAIEQDGNKLLIDTVIRRHPTVLLAKR